MGKGSGAETAGTLERCPAGGGVVVVCHQASESLSGHSSPGLSAAVPRAMPPPNAHCPMPSGLRKSGGLTILPQNRISARGRNDVTVHDNSGHGGVSLALCIFGFSSEALNGLAVGRVQKKKNSTRNSGSCPGFSFGPALLPVCRLPPRCQMKRQEPKERGVGGRTNGQGQGWPGSRSGSNRHRPRWQPNPNPQTVRGDGTGKIDESPDCHGKSHDGVSIKKKENIMMRHAPVSCPLEPSHQSLTQGPHSNDPIN